MAWVYKNFSSSANNPHADIYAQVQNELNQMDDFERKSSKIFVFQGISTSNLWGGIIYLESENTPVPDRSGLSLNWNYVPVESNDDTIIFESLIQYLNDTGNEINIVQKYWSRLTMGTGSLSNRTGTHNAAIWYQYTQ